jgi:hypothetical protein
MAPIQRRPPAWRTRFGVMVRSILDSCGVGKRAVFHRTSEIEMKTAPTATLVARLKREAKLAARAKLQSHANALDEAARAWLRELA